MPAASASAAARKRARCAVRAAPNHAIIAHNARPRAHAKAARRCSRQPHVRVMRGGVGEKCASTPGDSGESTRKAMHARETSREVRVCFTRPLLRAAASARSTPRPRLPTARRKRYGKGSRWQRRQATGVLVEGWGRGGGVGGSARRGSCCKAKRPRTRKGEAYAALANQRQKCQQQRAAQNARPILSVLSVPCPPVPQQ